MRRCQLVLAMASTLFASHVWAQSTHVEGYNRSAWQHCWALQFAVSQASLQSFDGATISLRRHFGQGSAMRLGLTLGPVTFSEYEREYPSDAQVEEGNRQAAGLDIEYIGYLGPGSNVSPHLLVGAGTTASREEWEGYHYSRYWSASLNAGFGVEWFVHRRVAISGEYIGALEFSDGYSDSYRDGQLESHTSYQHLILGNSRVRMGVAVSL